MRLVNIASTDRIDSCALMDGVEKESFTTTWKHIWSVAARSVSLLGTSRAASVLLHAILDAELLLHHVISDDINSIVTTADVNGPALLVDSSLLLMLRLLHLRNAKLPSVSQATCHHIIRWLFLRWNPGKQPQSECDGLPLISCFAQQRLCLQGLTLPTPGRWSSRILYGRALELNPFLQAV